MIKTDLQLSVEAKGVRAFERRDSEDDCPYRRRAGEPFSNERCWWFNGFFAARNATKFPKLFTLQELLASIVILVLLSGNLTASDKPTPLVVPARLIIPDEYLPQKPTPRLELIVPQVAAAAPSACPMDASVLITASEGNRTFAGSGTCVLSENGSSTILTSAHTFRGLTSPKITVTHQKKAFAGRLSKLDDANDLALIAVDADLPSVGLAGEKPRVSDHVTSIGIDAKGDGLDERNHKITAVDKYDNPRNFESDGDQIVGRSGGGLFFNGELCGVIQGRRNDVRRSIYVSIEPIRELLNQPVAGSSGEKTDVKIIMAPFHCPPCHRLAKACGIGNSSLNITTEVASTYWIPSEGGFPFCQFTDPKGTVHTLHGVASLEHLERCVAFYQNDDSVAATDSGVALSGKTIVESSLSWLESIAGDGCEISFSLHREGGKEALPASGKFTMQDVVGTNGRVEIVVKSTKGLPVHELKFDYRFAANANGKPAFFAKLDEIEYDLPEDGSVGASGPVGNPLLIAYTVISIAYDLYELTHPQADAFLGTDIDATAKLSNKTLSIAFTGQEPQLRLHWSFMFGLVKANYVRPLTGVVLSAENVTVQFHKSRIYRDVAIGVK